MPSVLRIRLPRLLSSRNHFTPYDIWVQNLTAYFHKIYNNSNGLSKVTVTITVLIIVYLIFIFHFFLSLQIWIKLSNIVFYIILTNSWWFLWSLRKIKTTVLLGGILRFPKSMNQIWQVGPTTDRIFKVRRTIRSAKFLSFWAPYERS